MEVEDEIKAATDDPNQDQKIYFPRGKLVKTVYRSAMIHRRKVVLSVIIALLITYTAIIQTSPLKTKKTSFPRPFFSPNSLVVDHFWGDVFQAFDQVQYSDVTFIMFYAPWDATSMNVRVEFEKTSRYYYNQVYFAAVNCWWPTGDCKQHFPKIRSFPLLIAYHNNGKGIAFHGTPTFPHLVQFLHHFINPINVIHDHEDLFQLLVKRDVVVLGYFDFGSFSMPDGYLTFHSAALKCLEKDPDHLIAFAVVSNAKDAFNFLLQSNGKVVMYNYNGNIVYNESGIFTYQKLLNWVLINKTQALKWVSLLGAKSNRLSTYFDSTRPTLVMLTPRFVTANLDRSPYFYMLKEIALEYTNCNNSAQASGTIRALRSHWQNSRSEANLLNHDRRSSQNSYCRLENKPQCCVSLSSSIQKTLLKYSACVISDVIPIFENLCQVLNREMSAPRNWNHFGCKTTYLRYNAYYYFQVCRYTKVDEIYSHTYKCVNPDMLKFVLLNHSDVHLGFDSIRTNEETDVYLTSQGCRSNRSLNFIAIDSLRSGFLFEKIGINVTSVPTKTAVAIINSKHETYHVLSTEVTIQSLSKFILNFTRKELPRFRQSLNIPLKYTNQSEEIESVLEVTSRNFHDVVINNNKDVVLLVYAQWCGSCFTINHIYLMVARYFKSSDIIFTRINGEENDLPWEFTIQNYPQVILFPSNRKSNSESFPVSTPMTTLNLIKFVLIHANQRMRMQTVLNLCTDSCLTHNRNLATNKISALLREFRLLDGQLKKNIAAVRRECHNSTTPIQILSYADNAKFLAQELNSVRTKLVHTKSLHLKLSTGKTSQFSREYLKQIIEEFDSFSNTTDFYQTEYQTFVNDLNRELTQCPSHILLQNTSKTI